MRDALKASEAQAADKPLGKREPRFQIALRQMRRCMDGKPRPRARTSECLRIPEKTGHERRPRSLRRYNHVNDFRNFIKSCEGRAGVTSVRTISRHVRP